MDYDFRNRANPPYDSQIPIYRPTTSSSSSSHPMYGPSSLYPRVGQTGRSSVNAPPGHASSFHHNSPSSSSSSSGLGIRVAIKPEYRITPPVPNDSVCSKSSSCKSLVQIMWCHQGAEEAIHVVSVRGHRQRLCTLLLGRPQMSPQLGEIPRSTFQFDFELERKILAEAEKESQNWSRIGIENHSSKPAESTSSSGSSTNPVSKYIASGLSREAVPLAVAHYGDNPTKVREFVNGFTLLQEMGFSSNNVAEALVMYDNDTDKALAHFLNSSS
ncbi:unnamed protein product [Camellia sinensis]